MSCAWQKGPGNVQRQNNVFKAGQPTRRILVVKCWLLVMLFFVLDRNKFGDIQCLNVISTRQGSRWKEASSRIVDCFSCGATCLTGIDPIIFSVDISADLKGSRREETSSWSVGCLSCFFTCLTGRSPGIFSVRQQFWQDRAADGKKPRLEVLIAFHVMPRAWQELTRLFSVLISVLT